MLPVTHVLYLASALFLLGLATAWLRRDRVIALLGVELMFASASLVLVAGSRYWADGDGQALATIVGIAMLAQVGVGVAMVATIRRPPASDSPADARGDRRGEEEG